MAGMRSIDHQNNLGFKLKRETLDCCVFFRLSRRTNANSVQCHSMLSIYRDIISCSAAVYLVTRELFSYTYLWFYRDRNLLSSGQIGKIRKLDQSWSALQPRPDATPASCYGLCAIIPDNTRHLFYYFYQNLRGSVTKS